MSTDKTPAIDLSEAEQIVVDHFGIFDQETDE